MATCPSGGLKRRYEAVASSSPFCPSKDSEDEISSSDSGDSCDSLNAPTAAFTPTSILRHQKPSPGGKRVRFDVVTVYYFPRRQGFTSVPSQGGSSLGMAHRHSAIRRYTLGEFAREQESSHRLTLQQHLRQEKLQARKMKLTRNGTVACAQAELLTLDDVSDEDLDVDAVEVDDCFFLQPLPTKRRRALLRASGIARIDAREKAELRAIRLSREECGCDCRLFCDPRRCGCSQAGIKCQVDRMSFPCGCSRDGCGNVAGRIEFNPLRVRTHYLHTVMKLDLERRRLPLPTDPAPSPSSSDLLAGGAGLDPQLGESGAQTEVQDLLVEQEVLERENETAVLHLQSAEEQERRQREEGGAPPQELLLQGPFPSGASLLCIGQEGGAPELLPDSAPLLYYQLGSIQPAVLQSPPTAEEVKEGEGEEMEGEEEEQQKMEVKELRQEEEEQELLQEEKKEDLQQKEEEELQQKEEKEEELLREEELLQRKEEQEEKEEKKEDLQQKEEEEEKKEELQQEKEEQELLQEEKKEEELQQKEEKEEEELLQQEEEELLQRKEEQEEKEQQVGGTECADERRAEMKVENTQSIKTCRYGELSPEQSPPDTPTTQQSTPIAQ